MIPTSGGDCAVVNRASILKATWVSFPESTPDPEVLKLSAEGGRVLVSADVKTMLVHFAGFIAHTDSPGIVVIPSSRSYSSKAPRVDPLLRYEKWMTLRTGQRPCFRDLLKESCERRATCLRDQSPNYKAFSFTEAHEDWNTSSVTI